MACREYKALLPGYVDGEIPPEQARLLRDHLPGCDSCRRTIRLLRLEDRAIRSALLGGVARRERRASRSRLVRGTLVATILVALTLFGLYGTYRGMAERVAATPEEILDREILVRQAGVPLPEFLAAVSDRAGVEIALSPGAARRLEPPPEVDIVLSRPVRLRSLLDLLGRFYGTRTRVVGDAVVLE